MVSARRRYFLIVFAGKDFKTEVKVEACQAIDVQAAKFLQPPPLFCEDIKRRSSLWCANAILQGTSLR
jgi:hypothetical protein